MEKSLDERRLELLQGETFGARKLTFREQCGAFACLYDGFRNQVVSRAFGLSIQSVSKLSGCLENDPDPYRPTYDKGTDLAGGSELRDHNRSRNPNRHRYYQTVAREFEALGPLEFMHRYYTERVHNRMVVAKEELRVEGRKVR